jgi:phenylacetate-coenzyme A ligase PaaK-like adenylate-forming protein
MTGALDEARLVVDLVRAGREGPRGIERRQRARLADLVGHARAGSRFYRQRYQGLPMGPVEARLLPAVTKPELMAAFDDWVTDPGLTRGGVERFVADPARIGEPYLGRYFVGVSSGTTGHPGVFVHDPFAVAVYRALVVRIDLTWLSPAQWHAFVSKGMRWAAVVGTGAHFAGAGWMESERRRSRWRRQAYRVFSVQQPLERLVPALDAFDPAILTGYSSALVQLADEQDAGRLHVRPVVVELAGESMGPAERARVAAVLGGALHDAYASSECQVIAIDCAHGWLHVNGDWVILEPVDADLQPTPPGQHSHTVLLTNLANRVQPIIRYDLGDSVLARPDPCPCGSPMPAIRVVGRRDDVLRLARADGRTVDILPLAISAVAEGVPGVHRTQIVQTGPRTIQLRLDPSPQAPLERVWQALIAALRDYLDGMGLSNVAVVRTDETPMRSARSGKFRQVIGTTDARRG